jgi:hypothetical protein
MDMLHKILLSGRPSIGRAAVGRPSGLIPALLDNPPSTLRCRRIDDAVAVAGDQGTCDAGLLEALERLL